LAKPDPTGGVGITWEDGARKSPKVEDKLRELASAGNCSFGCVYYRADPKAVSSRIDSTKLSPLYIRYHLKYGVSTTEQGGVVAKIEQSEISDANVDMNSALVSEDGVPCFIVVFNEDPEKVAPTGNISWECPA
jgi:hypothetical protein